MRLLYWLFLFAAFVLFPSSGVFGQTQTGTLVVNVHDMSGAVMPGAMIRVWLGPTRPDCLQYANKDGIATFKLAPGGYDVFVAFQGFSPVAKKIRVREQKVTRYNVKMKLDPLTKLIAVVGR